MTSPVPSVPVPLATAADFVKRFPELASDLDPEVIAELMVEATSHIEQITSRLFAPFTGHIYSDMLYGINPNEYGANAAMPLDIYGALGVSYANALGANDLVRHFWLDQFAPFRPSMWSYTIESMELVLTYGNTQPIDIQNGGIIMGPDPTSGHVWLRLGTFAPPGTWVQVVYSGGYTGGIPPDLKRACLFQAAKFAIQEAEQQMRSGMSLDELDSTVARLLLPYARV